MIENSIVYRDFKGKYDYLPVSKAKGSLIWDKDGKRLIDFSSAWNVTNLGWNHPEVRDAIIAQAKKNAQGLLWGSDPVQEEYATALTEALPEGLDACIKATGGTEAIESAVKIARAYTKRKRLIGFKENYHGQLFASLALGLSEKERPALAPLVPEISLLDFPHEEVGEEGFRVFLQKLEEQLKREDVAALVAEPGIITGWGSTLRAYPGFLTETRRLTEKYGTLLIIDEVGTGFSRTGKLFCIEHEQVTPDIIALAKAISNGAAAIGTAVGRTAVFEAAFSDAVLVSTFGWTPIACAAALETLRVHQRESTWELSARKGAYIQKKLTPLLGGKLTGIRGLGMEIGLQFADAGTCSAVRKAAFSDGLHVVVGSGNNMQLMPPLTISEDLLEEGLAILIKHL
ncbi:MAG: aspartate aminotransferase family protein [Patescibacteria group bacterium]|nr:aspartate aminotransferase family protein [Patescibacteria group bacterium]